MTDERQRDLGRRAANYLYRATRGDCEVLEIFVELIKDADLNVFKSRLLELHMRGWQEFDAKYPGVREHSAECETYPGEWANWERKLREAGLHDDE